MIKFPSRQTTSRRQGKKVYLLADEKRKNLILETRSEGTTVHHCLVCRILPSFSFISFDRRISEQGRSLMMPKFPGKFARGISIFLEPQKVCKMNSLLSDL
jgi:hypothetical protein